MVHEFEDLPSEEDLKRAVHDAYKIFLLKLCECRCFESKMYFKDWCDKCKGIDGRIKT